MVHGAPLKPPLLSSSTPHSLHAGYCQHSFGGRVCALALYLPVVVCPPLHSCWPLLGAQVHGGWTAVASSALDAAALSGVSRQEAALSFAPADLPSQRCHTGLVGAGSYSADGSLFNASNTCQHYPGNPAQLLGGADLWGRPSTCGCMQVPQVRWAFVPQAPCSACKPLNRALAQCDRGHQCDFDCGCTVKDQDVARALQAALLEPEVLLCVERRLAVALAPGCSNASPRFADSMPRCCLSGGCARTSRVPGMSRMSASVSPLQAAPRWTVTSPAALRQQRRHWLGSQAPGQKNSQKQPT